METTENGGSVLLFFCNGKKVIEKNPDPEMTLLVYLRKKLGLTGTKLGCAEGGCGACTVMVSSYNRNTSKIVHHAVNACLAPVCSVHGAAVTTVEGIGSTKTKLHPVQERIAKAHGSQCGFCTPGIVMSMYALLRNKPQPTMDDIHGAFEGNLCRCTGYRPILQAYKTFTKKDGCCGGGCQNGPSQNNSVPDNKEESGLLFDPKEFSKYDPSQDLIFPPDLLLSANEPAQTVCFRGERVTWFQPVTFDELLDLKVKYPHSKLIGGNSEIGVEVKFKNQLYPALVSVTQIPDLTKIEVSDDGVVIGSSVSLTCMDEFFKDYIKDHPGHKNRIFEAIVEMLRWFAGPQIRNVAAVGGNIVTGSPISDLNPIFMAARCTLELVSQSEGSRHVIMDENFFTGYRRNIIKPDEVLKSITIPFTKQNEYFFAYKQSPRREDDIAIVNAGMRVVLEEGTRVIQDVSLAYGGMAATTVLALKTMQKLMGKKWDESMLDATFSCLAEDLPLPAGAPGGMESYRKSLTISFFFKFYLMVLDQLSANQQSVASECIPSNFKSATSVHHQQAINATQFYQEVAPGQPSQDPVGRPLVHKSAYKQTTGEAVYIDDMPSIAGELYLAFVMSQKAHAKIISIDPSKALSLEGVHDFLSYKDVLGSNHVGSVFHDEELLATTEVHHVGQPIGAIIAETQALAQRGARLVQIEYEELESIITIEDAIARQSFFPVTKGFKNGDVEEALEKSDHVIEGEMKVGGQEHFYLETQCAFAIPKGEDGEIEIFVSTQHPTEAQKITSIALGVPFNRIVCRTKRIGGGFGGKESRSSMLAAICALAANKLNRPVRYMLDRDEDMISTGGRNPFLGRYKVGFTNEGKLTALDIDLYGNAGYSYDLSAAVLERAVTHIDNVYRFPISRVYGRLCRTNLPSNTAFRGFGGPQAMIICESFMTDIAIKLGLSQDKVRELNFYSEGDVTPCSQVLNGCQLRRCWEQCLEKSNYHTRRKNVDIFNSENRWKKRGLAITPTKFGISFTARFLNQAGALVHIYTDGSVLVTHGGIEMGQGLHTKMIQVASRTLGIPESKIHLSETNTSKVPNTSPTAASTGSDLNGKAIEVACQTLKQRLEPYMHASPKGNWDDWVDAAYRDRVSLSTTGFYKTPDLTYDWEKNEGKLFHYFSWGVGVSEVEIDCLTGDHTTLRTDIVMDVGNSINPAIDIGQIEGAFTQGYGLFTLEDHRWSPKGHLLTRGPGFYKIPGFGDVPPEFNVSLLKNAANHNTICSSKAVGEPPLFLGSSVFFAIKDAILAARSDEGLGNFTLNSPAVAERIRLACVDQFTKLFPEAEPGTYTPFFVRP
ncbi:xanthine dehydrogenase/oxidase-like [Lytechinus variegatus]|uniref:xanthine dehydrogenase/oxidase-like n=1 Tax=Lytechinus variegatus TaxID=7654 RepID=UPI001BB1C839|nr:xanthine dehydrogenase/oxidase-like [Lytechinus variegatus]